MISNVLITNSTLKTLNLRGSKFNLQALQTMCSMLIHNKTLTDVMLGFCHISEDGIICCLAKWLHSNNTLTTLDIANNSISDRGAESIAQALYTEATHSQPWTLVIMQLVM